MDFTRALETVVTFLQREGYACALIGGFAMQAYGMTRATLDLDFVADADSQEKLIGFLESLGYETLYRSSGYSNHLHTSVELGRLDFVYVRGETRHKLFASAREVPFPGGLRVRVPRAEHLAAMKIQAMKNDPERTLRELADIQFLLRLPGVDEEEIRGYFEKQGLLEKFHEIKRRS
jgi:hypothetical protein